MTGEKSLFSLTFFFFLQGANQPFKVEIQGPKGKVPARITDHGNGDYRVDYEPTSAGNHHIEVTLKVKETLKRVLRPVLRCFLFFVTE